MINIFFVLKLWSSFDATQYLKISHNISSQTTTSTHDIYTFILLKLAKKINIQSNIIFKKKNLRIFFLKCFAFLLLWIYEKLLAMFSSVWRLRVGSPVAANNYSFASIALFGISSASSFGEIFYSDKILPIQHIPLSSILSARIRLNSNARASC